MEYGIREVGERGEVTSSPSETREISTGYSHQTEAIDWPKQTILITGGAGSLGKHLCKILLEKYHPLAIRVYSKDELKQHEMRQVFGDDAIRYFIGDVRDGDCLKRAMEGADIVIHAAALKQVPACEYNPLEAGKSGFAFGAAIKADVTEGGGA